jgi:heat shock protein HtpX
VQVPTSRPDRSPIHIEVVALLGALLALFAGLGFLVAGTHTIHWGVVAGVALLGGFLFRAPHAILRRYRAVPIDEELHRGAVEAVRKLATKAGLDEPPELRVTKRDECDAFSVATPRRATIVIGEGLLARLDERHLEAVIAHEIGHIKNRDTAVLGFADLVVRMTRVLSQLGLVLLVANGVLELLSSATLPWGFVLALLVTPYVAKALFSVLGRAREHRADADAARLTGDPEALAEALEHLHDAPRPTKTTRLLRALNPYGIAPSPSGLRDHPPTALRAERLRRLAVTRERSAA